MASTGTGFLGSILCQLKGAVDIPHVIIVANKRMVINLLVKKYFMILFIIEYIIK